VYAQKKPRTDLLLLTCFLRVKICSSSFGMLISTMGSVFVAKLLCQFLELYEVNLDSCRSQWPRGLRRRSAAARLLRSWVRIPPGAWMFVCCECCVLSGRGLCDELITRPEESYRLCCVVVCDLENLKNEEAMTRVGTQDHSKKNKNKKIKDSGRIAQNIN